MIDNPRHLSKNDILIFLAASVVGCVAVAFSNAEDKGIVEILAQACGLFSITLLAGLLTAGLGGFVFFVQTKILRSPFPAALKIWQLWGVVYVLLSIFLTVHITVHYPEYFEFWMGTAK